MNKHIDIKISIFGLTLALLGSIFTVIGVIIAFGAIFYTPNTFKE